MKIFLIILVVYALLWVALMQANQMVVSPKNCGNAPGDVTLIERVIWGVCEASK